MNKLRRNKLFSFLLGISSVAPLSISVASAADSQTQQADSDTTRIQDLRTAEGAGRESTLNRAIEQILAQRAPQLMAMRELQQLSPQHATLAALEKNLEIAIGKVDEQTARQAFQEARAVFDPVLALDVGYRKTELHDRTLNGTVNAQVFRPEIASPDSGEIPAVGEIILPDIAREQTGVDRIIFQNVQLVREVQENQTIYASRRDPNGANDSWEYGAALTQQLPWGINYELSLVSANRDVFYDRAGHTFGKPWSSELFLDLEIPLGKDFGADSNFDTQIKLADKARERSHMALKATLNNTVLAVNLAYLQLLQTLENLKAANEIRELLEDQRASVERLFKARSATAYDTAQINGELERAFADEHTAINAYLDASDALAVLVEDDSQATRGNAYLPTAYTLWLESEINTDASSAHEIAKQNNPKLQIERVNVESAELAQHNAVRQTAADVSLNASMGLIQDGSIYGYDSFFDSLGNITDPDVTDQALGVNYRYPIGNAALQARRSQAEGRTNNANLDLRAVNNDIERQVEDALSAVDTTRARIVSAQSQLTAAQTAYDSLSRRATKAGDVSRNEVVLTLRRLLAAKRSIIGSRIDNKRAETKLLAALGILHQRYASWSSRNRFERMRLKRLTESGEFSFFLSS